MISNQGSAEEGGRDVSKECRMDALHHVESPPKKVQERPSVVGGAPQQLVGRI